MCVCYATLWVVWGVVERGGSLMNVLVPRECLLDSLTNWFCTATSVSLERNQLLDANASHVTVHWREHGGEMYGILLL